MTNATGAVKYTDTIVRGQRYWYRLVPTVVVVAP
jgi:hypothetical protein